MLAIFNAISGGLFTVAGLVAAALVAGGLLADSRPASARAVLSADAAPKTAFARRPFQGADFQTPSFQLAQQDFTTPFATPRVPRNEGWTRDGNRWQPRNPAWGGRDNARDAVRRGEILPLERVVAAVKTRYPGRVLDVRLDETQPIYRLRLLGTDGRVRRISADARTGDIVSVEGGNR